jgi:hypothetical protein
MNLFISNLYNRGFRVSDGAVDCVVVYNAIRVVCRFEYT